ncbi:VWA domain-containing protein [Arthrobacter sp. ISL-30]|uniref:vWA domain-containing protein n=1 Tax=Arthrobacter sp. ISL-30 TaxID=2819109 RepID=UPI001BEA900E|nr:VWA domain-containing protein [Arthrobacter sp. ISL-30]MBT2513546.1 VWA domain-containing protein [Arthrobacter sp. ISL-30]
MELTLWWMLPLATAVGIVATLILLRRGRGKQPQRRYIAHRERLAALPEYRRALRSHRRWLWIAAVSAGVLLAAAVVAAARPVQSDVVQPETRNRDIVLCLDVSGSMGSTDSALVEVFADLAKEFDGERIGMVIFDSRAVQLFPLTDDYAYISTQLQAARDAFDGKEGTSGFFDGTWSGAGSSLIGDGLATCVQSFPAGDDTGAETGPERSRSVILATDNFLSGTPIFTLEEAGELATTRGVHVHALNPGDFDSGDASDQPGARLKAVAEGTGGVYATPDSPDSVSDIVAKVQATEALSYRAAPEAVVTDSPAVPLAVGLLAGASLLIAAWKLEP